MKDNKIVEALSKARRLLVEEELTKYGDEPCGILVVPAAKSIEKHNQIGTAVTILASAILIAEAIENLIIAAENLQTSAQGFNLDKRVRKGEVT